MSKEDKKFHIVKDIPITVLLLLGIQIFGSIWWFASMDSRVLSLESKISAMSTHESRIAVLESNNANARSDRLRMEVKIDRILERIPLKP